MKKFTWLFVYLFIILFYGCGSKNDGSGSKSDEKKNEPATENVDPKTNDPAKEETNTGKSTEDISKTNELGMTPGLPSNFPTDVPQPKNSKTLGSLNSSEGTVVTFESSDKVQDIVNYYKEEMKKNGYVLSEDGEDLVTDKGGLINWKRESKEVGLMLGYDKDRNVTSLVITYK